MRIAMVTGKGKNSTEISLRMFNLEHSFEHVETGSPDGQRKAEGIQIILDKFNELKKDEVVYVGDAPSDIIACRKVGILVIAAAWADTAEADKLRELMPDKIFYSIHDFSEWLYDNV